MSDEPLPPSNVDGHTIIRDLREGLDEPEPEVTYVALPIRDRLLIRVEEAATHTAGGLLIPDEAKQKPRRGVVLATGPGRILDNGYHLEMDIKPGALVVFGKFSGVDVEVNGEQLLILREDEVMLVLEPR